MSDELRLKFEKVTVGEPGQMLHAFNEGREIVEYGPSENGPWTKLYPRCNLSFVGPVVFFSFDATVRVYEEQAVAADAGA